MTEMIQRIQWSNSARPKVTIYGDAGVMAILEGPSAGIFTGLVWQSLQFAMNPTPAPEPTAEGVPV